MTKFSRLNKLANKKDFDYVFEDPKRIASQQFVFLYRINRCAYARLGIIIPKKKVAKAHDRNRMKRYIRESFRMHSPKGIDVVVLAKANITHIDNAVLHTNLNKIWEKLEI